MSSGIFFHELVQEPKDVPFLADLFERVFARLKQPDGELTGMGRVMVATNLMPLVERLRRHAEGRASSRGWSALAAGSESVRETSNAARGSLSFAARCRETLGV